MKNRNDDKKYILNEYRKKQIKRLFIRLEEIHNKKPKSDSNIIKRIFGNSQSKLSHIPKNHTQQRLYEIRKENQRLVDKLSSTKMTVVSHRRPNQTNRTFRKFKLRDTLRQQEIEYENRRLFKAIGNASSNVARSNSVTKFNRII